MKVQEFKGLKVQEFKGWKGSKFNGSNVQGSKSSRVCTGQEFSGGLARRLRSEFGNEME